MCAKYAKLCVNHDTHYNLIALADCCYSLFLDSWIFLDFFLDSDCYSLLFLTLCAKLCKLFSFCFFFAL